MSALNNAMDDEVFTAPAVAPPLESSSEPQQPPQSDHTSDAAGETSTLVPVPPSQPHPPTVRPAERRLAAPPATSPTSSDAALVDGVETAAAVVVAEGEAEVDGGSANVANGDSGSVVERDAPVPVTSADEPTPQTHEGEAIPGRPSSPAAFAGAEGRDGDGEQAVTASPPPPPAAEAAAAPSSAAWVVDFGTVGAKPKRKMTKKEKDAITESRLRRQQGTAASTTETTEATATATAAAAATGLGADSEGNAVQSHDAAPLQHVQLDGLADRAALIPLDLTTTRADLEQRLVLRLPRLLCVNKQYPRGCGIASLTSVYNYLYSWLGESEVGAGRAPHSQEEMMSILGFEPPFGEIAWGPFTGNVTLIRWFHALNRHFGLRGRAYILYKAHGHGKTTHLYPDNDAALRAVKAALRDPHCALIYHCHNHYMVPVGYQEIPQAQTDFLQPTVPETSTDTTIFIGEVSRGRHEAMYARKWEQIVKDIECQSPFFFNIRHPEQGVQRREPKKKAAAAANAAAEGSPAGAAGEAADARATNDDGNTDSGAPAPASQDPPAAESTEAAAADGTAGVTPSAAAAAAAAAASVVAAEPSVEVLDAQGDAEPAEPPASPVMDPGDVDPLPATPPTAPDAETAPLPPFLTSESPPVTAAPRRTGRPPAVKRLVRQAASTTPPPPSSSLPAKPKPERGNLHCLIIFRNDQTEEHLGRYEDDVKERLAGAAVRRSSSASFSSDGSSSSDEDA